MVTKTWWAENETKQNTARKKKWGGTETWANGFHWSNATNPFSMHYLRNNKGLNYRHMVWSIVTSWSSASEEQEEEERSNSHGQFSIGTGLLHIPQPVQIHHQLEEKPAVYHICYGERNCSNIGENVNMEKKFTNYLQVDEWLITATNIRLPSLLFSLCSSWGCHDPSQ